MIVRFTETATAAEREAALAAVRQVRSTARLESSAIAMDESLPDEDALRVAAMPGVAAIEAAPATPATLREAILDWLCGASLVLGVLVILTSLFAAPLGPPADTLRTPPKVEPTWALLPWYAGAESAPEWAPVPLLFCLAAVALLFWPNLARRFATEHPRLHAALGATALLLAVALAARQVMR